MGGIWGVRGLVHPRTSIGGGARRIQVICAANDAGDVGRGRSEAESPGHPISLRSKILMKKKMPALVGQDEAQRPRVVFYVEQLTAEENQKDRDIGGGDAGDARGLGDGGGAVAL